MFTTLCRSLKTRPNLIKDAACNCGKSQISSLLNQTPLNHPVVVVTSPSLHNLQICRFKSNKTKNKQSDSETDERNSEADALDNVSDRNTKTLKINVTSLRLDAILKSSLGIARNKIETMFYESKLRVNGHKVTKKSHSVREGDEIDVIKGVNVGNKDFLTVARVEILGATANEDSITLKIRRFKSLTVDNYKDKWEP